MNKISFCSDKIFQKNASIVTRNKFHDAIFLMSIFHPDSEKEFEAIIRCCPICVTSVC